MYVSGPPQCRKEQSRCLESLIFVCIKAKMFGAFEFRKKATQGTQEVYKIMHDIETGDRDYPMKLLSGQFRTEKRGSTLFN